MRLIKIAALVAAVLGAQQLAKTALPFLPAGFTYTLTGSCTWQPRAWARMLNAPTPAHTAQTDDAVYRCHLRRGLKGDPRFVNRLLTGWPSPAQFAAWEARNEDRRALSAGSRGVALVPTRHR